nr:Hint domain-containing protein [Pseudoroseicyclus aestuarii]
MPSFTPGIMIATPRGEVPVEQLRPGDRVITRDNGIQEIRWAGRRDMGAAAFSKRPALRPVMIAAGALGNGLPEQPMMVAPGHRVLIANPQLHLYFAESEVLVAARHLLGRRGVHEVSLLSTTYLHMTFDDHEVVLSNGAWTECFQPGDHSVIGSVQRRDLLELYPALETGSQSECPAAARRALDQNEARLFVV